MKKLSILIMLSAVSACSPYGFTRLGDTIVETGSTNCTGGSTAEQALVVGTAEDPVRCGPQTQNPEG